MEYVQGKASTTAEGHRWPTSSTGVMLGWLGCLDGWAGARSAAAA